MRLSPTRENTWNSHSTSTPPGLPLVEPPHISVTVHHREYDSGPDSAQTSSSSSSSAAAAVRCHALQPRASCVPALRKRRHVRRRRPERRRRGADGRGALPQLRTLQPAVRQLGLQLQQPRGQVRGRTAAEGQEAPERLHHLDQRGAQAPGAAQPGPGEHGPEQNPR